MGGCGSGRPATYGGKARAEDSLPLDIRRLQRSGVLTPGQAFSWQWTVRDRVRASIQVRVESRQVELAYSYTPTGGVAETIRHAVLLESTPCNLGGSRLWFSCPTCARRVAVLYGRGRLFACRQCKGLAYASQGEDDGDRAARRAERIRKRLGWPPGILSGPGVKPPGMHWRTYERLRANHDDLVRVSLVGMAQALGLLRDQLDDIEDAAALWR